MWPFLATASLASSLFNTYANFKSQKETRNEAIYVQESNLAFAKKKKLRAMREYGAIIGYNIDMIRQQSLEKREIIGVNILNSGIAITPFDSAGLLLRHQAYHDELLARAKETELYRNRPQFKQFNLNKNLINHQINAFEKSAPFSTISAAVTGAIDLSKILQKISGKNR